ncbi:HNH endonuclease [Candidatus Pacearchaeota archaeon]|nr:HNH endonuclease [Candidatus Pacearchaeota archaeon]
MGARKWSDSDLIAAVSDSKHLAEVMKKLGITTGTNNYKTIKKSISGLNIDTSHFATTFPHIVGVKIPLEEILIQNSPYTNTSHLKERLLRAGLVEDKCSNCNSTHWLGCKLSLHLDHINGNNTDNRIDNLRLLCPNCHSLTDTYCRGVGKKRKHIGVSSNGQDASF